MKLFKRKLFLTIFTLILIFSSTPVAFAAQTPSIIRIGLLFNYGNLKTAVDSFNISAEKGIEAGWYAQGNFNLIYSNADNTVFKVSKNTKYYYEYSKDIASKDQALDKVNEITTKGVNAFVGLNANSNWVVIVGGYADKASADNDKANISAKLPDYEITLLEPSARSVLIENSAGQAVTLFYSGIANLTIKPTDANELKVVKVNTLVYRGEIEVIRQQASDMTVINVLPTEQYLYGVVPSEIGGSSPTEALKAQAIAARTYTVNNINKYSSIGFNLCNTTYSQVYKGFSSEVLASNKAIDATAGEVLTYNGKPAAVFYFSSSGGKTEDVKNVWGSTYPYLVSVDDSYETPTTTNYTWTKTFTAEQIKSKVSKDIGDVTGMEITQRSEVGRVTELVIKGTKDQAVYKLEGARTILSLPSQWYSIQAGAQVSVGTSGNATSKDASSLNIISSSGVTKSPSGGLNVIGANGATKSYSTVTSSSSYTLTGRGWGHAVGMSQNGAMGMARAGFTYKQIMEHYFKGTVVQVY